MIEVKRFSGAMNTDDKVQDVGGTQHIYANNIRFTGGQTGLTAENVKGNYVINNASLPPGLNSCIGAFFDQLKNRIIWFNYNQQPGSYDHGIYQLDLSNNSVSPIFICGVNTVASPATGFNPNILNFNLNYPIHSVNIVYRDGGDLLYWTDGYNPPRYLNISQSYINNYSPNFTDQMITVSKMPPLSPIRCIYDTNPAYSSNNVFNRYFRFSYRYVYANGEKSTFAPTSALSLNNVDPSAFIPSTSYNTILLQFTSPPLGTEDFSSIEIYGQEFRNEIWGDFFLITTVDRTSAALPYNGTFTWYNDGSYTPILPEESDLRYDYVPLKANTLELLNGNVLIYGGITEGYNALKRQNVSVVINSFSENLEPLIISTNRTIWKWSERERFGLIYFDEFGKTNGVVSFLANPSIDSTNFDVNTTAFQSTTAGVTFNAPAIRAYIYHQAPSWAVSYQWVRVDSYPQFFLQWISNDFIDPTPTDPSADFFIGIQSLLDANSNGLVPVFDFKPGDRVRVISSLVTDYNETAFGTVYDYEIKEVVQKPMTPPNPATNGAFLRVSKKSGSLSGYTQRMRIEIYTPTFVNKEDVVFYEWGQRGTINSLGEHSSTTTGGLSQAQNIGLGLPCVCEWSKATSGSFTTPNWQAYVYYQGIRTLLNPIYLPGGGGVPQYGSAYLVSRYVNLYQDSRTNSNSRGWIIEPLAKNEYLSTSVRWGGSYQQDSNVNELNRFYPSDIDTIDKAKGDIRRFKARDRILRVFQDRGVGQYGIYTRYIQNNSNGNELVTTNDIITANNIQYYAGSYGLGGYSTNLASSAKADYFTDIITGRSIRLSNDGVTDLGLLYKGQYNLPKLILKYNNTNLYYSLPNGGQVRSKVMGFYDSYDDDYHVFTQGISCYQYQVEKIAASVLPSIVYYTDCSGVRQSHEVQLVGDIFIFCALYDSVDLLTAGGGALQLTPIGPNACSGQSTNPEHFSFNERRNAFCSFYDYHPEWAIGANDIIYTWVNGELWKHDNTTSYCSFYGQNKNASVQVVFNNNLLIKKSWNSINEIASDIWGVPEMYTNSYSYGTQVQQTNLVDAEFTILEGNPSSAIKRDVNSVGGKINGNFMKGNYLVVKFQKTNAQNLVTLSEISTRFTESPLTAK